jgi:hypothetical protein
MEIAPGGVVGRHADLTRVALRIKASEGLVRIQHGGNLPESRNLFERVEALPT